MITLLAYWLYITMFSLENRGFLSRICFVNLFIINYLHGIPPSQMPSLNPNSPLLLVIGSTLTVDYSQVQRPGPVAYIFFRLFTQHILGKISTSKLQRLYPTASKLPKPQGQSSTQFIKAYKCPTIRRVKHKGRRKCLHVERFIIDAI